MEGDKKIVRSTLDGLPYGERNSGEELGKVGKPKMPEGIKKSQLTRDIIRIAWPSLIELILTQLTTMADQIMVGRLPGQEGIMALSAVGLAGQPKMLLMTMIQAMNVGATAVVARFRGQQNQQRANQVFKQALLLNFIMASFFMLIGLSSCEPLIRFMSGNGISEETLQYGVKYLNIQLYGFIPMCLTFTITASLRGIGDTRTPMIYNTVANVVNVFFNYVMIYGKLGCPAMGVVGASCATVIGQTVAFFIAVSIIISKRRYIYVDFKEKFKFDKVLMGSVVKIGVPSMIEQLFMRAGMIIYTRVVAGLGDTMYATHQVCMSIQSLSFMMGQAFSSSSTTLMGQSLGKRRFDMAALYMRQARNLGRCCSFLIVAIMVFFGKPLVGMYNTNSEVIEIGSKILLLLAVCQPFQADQFICSGGLRGAGDTRYTAMVIAITTIGVRSGLGLLMVNVFHLGLWGAWIALACDQLIRTALMAVRYRSGKWKRMAVRRFKALDAEV